jgi:hypothetical protein
MDGFLENIRHYGFTVTSMAFQDADNLDFERMRFCSSHVYRDGRFIPLCAAYLTPCRTEAVSLHPGGLTLTERALSLAGLPRGAHVADVGSGTGKACHSCGSPSGSTPRGWSPMKKSGGFPPRSCWRGRRKICHSKPADWTPFYPSACCPWPIQRRQWQKRPGAEAGRHIDGIRSLFPR